MAKTISWLRAQCKSTWETQRFGDTTNCGQLLVIDRFTYRNLLRFVNLLDRSFLSWNSVWVSLGYQGLMKSAVTFQLKSKWECQRKKKCEKKNNFITINSFLHCSMKIITQSIFERAQWKGLRAKCIGKIVSIYNITWYTLVLRRRKGSSPCLQECLLVLRKPPASDR